MKLPVSLHRKRVLIAKTTRLGDLIISLPLAGALKRKNPSCTVIFLVHPSVADIARCCPDVDEVHLRPDTTAQLLALLARLCVDIAIQVNHCKEFAEAACRAGIPFRIGSLFRPHNWRRCTHLVALSSSVSGLNKRLIELQYLKPLGVNIDSLEDVCALYKLEPMPPPLQPAWFAQTRKTIVLNPTLVTARAHQWPLHAYSELIRMMASDRVHWFICGTPDDRTALRPLLERHAHDANVTDLVGSFSLKEYAGFIAQCDALVAGSTGPLHLAAALGVHALGLFQSRRVDRQRWRPVGKSTALIYSHVRCLGERQLSPEWRCPCVTAIKAELVAHQLLQWLKMGDCRTASI